MSAAAQVVTALAGARKAVQLYPPAHPSFVEAVDALVGSAQEAVATGSFTLNMHQGRLYHESIVLPDDVHGASSIAEAFESRSIESLAFQPGFSESDARGLIDVLSLRPSPDLDIEAELTSRGVTGVTVSLLADDDPEKEERDRQREADRALYQRLLGALRTISSRLSQGSMLELGGADQLVGNVLQRVMDDPSAMLALATMRGVGERQLFHSMNVMIYSLTLGTKLGLPEEGLSSLGLSAMLHDIGKSAFIADDPEQAEPMRVLHPQTGAEILSRAGMEDPAPMLVAYEHHMAPDGSGWPERAADYVAHPYSRMVAIADRYESLTNPGNGHDPLTPDRAIVQLLHEAGALVDPFFARLFAQALGVFPVGCLVRLSDQSVGVVSRVGEDPLAPVVRLAYDARGRELDEPDELDLGASEVRIVEVIEPDALNLEVAEKL